jgi:hypothetical protein
MLNVTNFEREPTAILIERRQTGISDIWLRKNVTAPTTEEESWTADEAYMQIATEDCPAQDDILADFDGWFSYAAEWKPEKQKSLAQLQADIEYIASMCDIDLG